MAESYGMKEDELAGKITDKERKQIAEDLKVGKAVDFVSSNAVEK